MRDLINWLLGGGDPPPFDPYSDPGEHDEPGDHSEPEK